MNDIATHSTTAPIIVACATFKGTLSSKAAGESIARGLQAAGLNSKVVVLADGGEGLVEALACQVKGALMVGAPCRSPLQTPRTATLAMLPQSGGLVGWWSHPRLTQ